MKTLTDRACKMESGAVGGLRKVCRQRFEIEETDIGRVKENFGGYNYKSHTITKADVGKVIEVMDDDSGWRCWGFIL